MNVRRIFPFALFALLLALAIQPTVDPDMWWHLRTGEAIVADGIPRHDLFSFTFPTNEWVTHEWLSQVIMWGIFSWFGLNGLMIFFGVVVTATFWLVYRISDGKPYVAGMVTMVAAGASSIVWGSRPQLFNLLLLAVFVHLLERRKDGELGRWIYIAFPLLTVLWVNLHSGYLLGIVVLATYLVGEFLEQRRAAPDARTLVPGEVARLGLATGVSGLAALANPNGARMWIYPFETIGSSVQREFITEWFPPTPDEPIFWVLILMISAGIFGFARAARRPSVTELLVFGGTAVGGFLSARNIPIFAVAVTPILARSLADALRYEPVEAEAGALRPPTALAGAVIAIAALAIAATTLITNATTVRETFPVAAVDWIESNDHRDSRIFNAYGWGGYLIWRGFPVYVDGRADVYGDDGLLQFARTYYADPGWDEPLDRYDIDLVMVEREAILASTLEGTADWTEVYEDPLARIFARAR